VSIPEKIVDRYRHVQGLASRGVGGERRNARRILDRLEEQHPGIAQAAQEAERQDAGAYAPPPPPSDGWPPSPGPYEGGIFHREGWGEVFRDAAREAATAFAAGFAGSSGLTQDQAAQLMDAASRVAGRVTRNGNYVVDLRIDQGDLFSLLDSVLDDRDLRLLADAGAELVFARLFDLLEEAASETAVFRRRR